MPDSHHCHPSNGYLSHSHLSRRGLLKAAALAAGQAALAGLLPEELWAASRPPASPVGIARCSSYDPAIVTARLRDLLDRIGGVGSMVRGKTVTLKPNITGGAGMRDAGLPASRSFQTHPNVVLAAVRLMHDAGARRIRIVESAWSNEPFERYLARAGYDLRALEAAGGRVEFEDTHNRGAGKGYARHRVPWGGYIYPAYDLNHSYSDTDVFVSIAKMKNHTDAGVTLTVKNLFGITPTSLYGSDAGAESSLGARGDILHEGQADPPAGVPRELRKDTPREAGYRVPRIVAEMLGIRPVDLAILDGVESVAGGEGPWCSVQQAVSPHLLLVGRNAVCTDAVAMAVMGYDARAGYGSHPFPGENHLSLCAKAGLGTNDIRQIEVVGLPVAKARYPYDAHLG